MGTHSSTLQQFDRDSFPKQTREQKQKTNSPSSPPNNQDMENSVNRLESYSGHLLTLLFSPGTGATWFSR